jgi:hypothetical protein
MRASTPSIRGRHVVSRVRELEDAVGGPDVAQAFGVLGDGVEVRGHRGVQGGHHDDVTTYAIGRAARAGAEGPWTKGRLAAEVGAMPKTVLITGASSGIGHTGAVTPP